MGLGLRGFKGVGFLGLYGCLGSVGLGLRGGGGFWI